MLSGGRKEDGNAALPPTADSAALPPWSLDAYGMSPGRGFLPATDPISHSGALKQLTAEVFSRFESLAEELPGRLACRAVRDAVHALTPFSSADLAAVGTLSDLELERAALVLTFLAHSYVWGEQPHSEILPAVRKKILLDAAAPMCCLR